MFQNAQTTLMQKVTSYGAMLIAPTVTFFLLPLLREHVYPFVWFQLKRFWRLAVQVADYVLWRPLLFFLRISVHGLHYIIVGWITVEILERLGMVLLQWYNQHYDITESHVVQSAFDGVRAFFTSFAAKPLGSLFGGAYDAIMSNTEQLRDVASNYTAWFYLRHFNQTS